mgnify:FL=1
MITKEIIIGGEKFNVTLTDSVISQVNQLKSLYNTAYEDPESFEQISSEISNIINTISNAAEPKANDSQLDGLIQQIIKTVDAKAAEIEKISKTNVGKKTDKKHKSKK